MSLLSLKIQIWLFILRFFNNNCFWVFFPSKISSDSLSTSADTPSSSSSWLSSSYLYGLFLLFFIVFFLFGLNLALKAWLILLLSYLFFVLWFESLRLENHFQVVLAYLLFVVFFLLILFMVKIQSKNLRWRIFFFRLKIQSPCYCRQLILFQNPRCHQQVLLWSYLQSAAFAN